MAQYDEIYQLIDRDDGGVSSDTILETLSGIPGLREATMREAIQQVVEREEEVSVVEFNEVMDSLQEGLGVDTDAMLLKLYTVLLHEVFALRCGKDGKMTKSDLKRYLESLQGGKRVMPQETDRYLGVADLEKKSITRDEFVYFLTDVMPVERDDISLADYIIGGRTGQASTAFEALRAKGVGKLALSFNVLKGTMGLKKDKQADAYPMSPTVASPKRRASVSPPPNTNTGLLKTGWGKVKERLSSSSPVSSPNAPERPCVQCGQHEITVAELRSDLVKSKRATMEKDSEVLMLKKRLEKIKRETTSPPPDGALEAAENKNIELVGKNRQLKQQLSDLQAHVASVIEDRNNKVGRVSELGIQLESTMDRAMLLEKELDKEKEKYDEAIKMRRQHNEVETKRMTENAKMKAELREKEESLSIARKRLEELEIEKRLAEVEYSDTVMSPFSGRHDGLSADGSDGGDNVMFLSPQKWAPATKSQSTLFDTTEAIVHTFTPPISPKSVLLDIYVVNTHVPEYITFRDTEGLRSVCLVINGALIAPAGSTQSAPLPSGTWHSVSIVINWADSTYTVYMGSTGTFLKIPFRDAATHLAVFDIHPRTAAGVHYANIRFIAEDE